MSLFKKNKIKIEVDRNKWNKMWNLWAEEKIESPYKELMTYQSEINNGGHDQYFFNIENTGKLEKEINVLKTILPKSLKANLEKAYNAYLKYNDKEDKLLDILEKNDEIFYKYEEDINQILETFSSTIKL